MKRSTTAAWFACVLYITEQMCITQGLCLYLSETNAIILAEDKYLDIAREALNQQDRLLTLYMYSTAVKEHA